MKAVCPNCGFSRNEFGSESVRPAADLVLKSLSRPVKRWDVVAIRGTDAWNIDKQLVKRVVGLPGERVRIRGGEIWIDDRLAVKPPSVCEQMMIPVFDSRSQPNGALVTRLLLDNESAPLIKSGNEALMSRDPDETKRLPSYTYQHIRGYRHRGPRFQLAAVEDSYGYNQNLPRRLNTVNQWHVRFDLVGIDEALIEVRFDVDAGSQSLRFDFRDQVLEWPDGRQVRWKQDETQIEKQIFVSRIDGRLRVRLDNNFLGDVPLSMQETSTNEKPLQLRYSNQRGRVTFKRTRIWRDVYYLNISDPQTGLAESWSLGTDQYFVLGDNAPVSIDSRQHGPINKASLLGHVLNSD